MHRSMFLRGACFNCKTFLLNFYSVDSSDKCHGFLQAEIDRGRGLAVMLFQIEANVESLVIYICPNALKLSF